MSRHQSYQLRIRLHKDAKIQVGALGVFTFPAGDYIYTGSAKRGLQARIQRHCRKDKPRRWHIDYLSSHPQAEVVDTQTFPDEECPLNQATAGTILVPGFGASDCRAACASHLKYLGPG